MTILTATQIQQFRETGWLLASDAVTPEQLAGLKQELNGWVGDSRSHSGMYGETGFPKPRFDCAPDHRPDHPQLRRVNNPQEISDIYAEVGFNSAMVDMAADLVGPSVKFHHSKVNNKQPGGSTVVDWHQDFTYTPHTNDDMVTALLLLDDMTAENGCLLVAPGSHLNGARSLWQDGKFTGKVDIPTSDAAAAIAQPVTGRAGDVWLMHSKLLHASEANASDSPRGLFIINYVSADAMSLAPSPMANSHEGKLLRGEAARFARLTETSVELPADYGSITFFELQNPGIAS